MSIEFTKIKHDTNGNPRYVCHFLNLLTEQEKIIIPKYGYGRPNPHYQTAIKRANKIGGRKFHNKQYGGGIVFSTYSIEQPERYILRVVEEAQNV